MFTTTVPVYPGKVRDYADKVLKTINIIVFIGVWACLIITINRVRSRARRTIDDFWVSSGDVDLEFRLLQRLDASNPPCQYSADIDAGGFTVRQTIGATNRQELFAETAGQIRAAVFISGAAVAVSWINRIAFNYNWHAITYYGDTNFQVSQTYFLLIEIALIIWSITALALTEKRSNYLSDYIKACGGSDIPHLFGSDPFIEMYIAHGATLLSYAVNWILFLRTALRPVRSDVKAAWRDVQQVLAYESAPNFDKHDAWVADGCAGRPLVEHTELRLRELLDGRDAANGFPAVTGLRVRLWEAHGYGKKRKRPQPTIDEKPGELKLDTLIVRDAGPASGTYYRVKQEPEDGWPASVDGKRGVWSTTEIVSTESQGRYLFWVLSDPSLPEDGGNCWVISDRLMHPARDPRLDTDEAPTVLFAHNEMSPIGIEWEDEKGIVATTVTAEVDTPYGPGIVLRAAITEGLGDYWWVELADKNQVVRGGVRNGHRDGSGGSLEIFLKRSDIMPRKTHTEMYSPRRGHEQDDVEMQGLRP